jgi:hypothetical protein
MSTLKRLLPLALGLSLALIALSAVPAHAADPIVSLNLQAGTRTASLTSATLDPITYKHVEQNQTGSFTLTVDDSTGSGAGWNVTILSSAIVYSGANGGTNIPAANLSITTANTPVATAGQAVDVTGGPLAGTASTLDAARKVIYASTNFGQGTYTQALPLQMVVPGMSRAGAYTATITVTMAAGPGA